MPWIKHEELEWIWKHSFYPTIQEKNGKYHFGNLTPRSTIRQAIQDAMRQEKSK